MIQCCAGRTDIEKLGWTFFYVLCVLSFLGFVIVCWVCNVVVAAFLEVTFGSSEITHCSSVLLLSLKEQSRGPN